MGAKPFYAWGPSRLGGPGNSAGQYPFERFTTNPLYSAYGFGARIVKNSLQLQNRSQTLVNNQQVVNSLTGNGLTLQGVMWVQSLADAQALGSQNVSG